MFGKLELTTGTAGFANVNNFEPGARYLFTLDGGTQDDPARIFADRSPGQRNIDARLWLHIPNGPSTHQILSLSNGREIGSQLI